MGRDSESDSVGIAPHEMGSLRPPQCVAWLENSINRFLGFWVSFYAYHYNSINTAPIVPIFKSHYELASSATILVCCHSSKSCQSHRFDKNFTISLWLVHFKRQTNIPNGRARCKFIVRFKNQANRTSRTSHYSMRKVSVSPTDTYK